MRILCNLSKDDIPYQGILSQRFGSMGHICKAVYQPLDYQNLKKVKGVDAIYCTNIQTIENLIPASSKEGTTNWRGSTLFTSVPIIIGAPLSNIKSTTTGKFLFEVDTFKVNQVMDGAFQYDWKIVNSETDLKEAWNELSTCEVIVSDIETSLLNKITSIAFTPILDNFTIGTTYVVTFDSKLAHSTWQFVRDIYMSPVAKVFHNGCFDAGRLLAYHCIPYNYIYDTEYIWKCWQAELRKALFFVASVVLPDFYYWKHESETAPLEYNAKDSINTARIFIYMLKNAPTWVWENYSQMAPNIYPCIYTQYEGFLVDTKKRSAFREIAQNELDKDLTSLKLMTSEPEFNPGSWQQVSKLLYGIFKQKKPRSKSKAATGEKELKKVAMRHPIFSIIVDLILEYRQNKKAISTYYDCLLDNKNRLYYSFAVDGTETGRMACNSSSVWAPFKPGVNLVRSNARNLGTQLQNQPVYAKRALKADDGYLLCEIDKSQSEARCTAYLAKSIPLKEALENPPELPNGVKDFYCYTGYLFFGIVFDKDHPLRQIVKKIIHGTNYIMQESTFIDSVGAKELFKYKQMLKFRGTLTQFAAYLLGLYHKAYPEVAKEWEAIVQEVARTGKTITPDGWVRIVRGDIIKDKAVMRSIVAHRSQHFSVVGINEAFWKLFFYVQVPSKGEYRLKGQIHDSIISQIKEEKIDYYKEKQKSIMDIPQPTPFGVMRIPLDVTVSTYWKEEK